MSRITLPIRLNLFGGIIFFLFFIYSYFDYPRSTIEETIQTLDKMVVRSKSFKSDFNENSELSEKSKELLLEIAQIDIKRKNGHLIIKT